MPRPPQPDNWLRKSQAHADVDVNVNVDEDVSDGSKGKRKAGASLAFTRKKRKVEGLMRSTKVRVYPNAKQSTTIKQWTGCAR